MATKQWNKMNNFSIKKKKEKKRKQGIQEEERKNSHMEGKNLIFNIKINNNF